MTAALRRDGSVDTRMLLGEHAEEHVRDLALDEHLATATPKPWTAELETEEERESRRRIKDAAERTVREMLAREKRGDALDGRPPFASPVHALRALDAARIDGAPLRSTSDHSGAGGTSGVGAVPHGDQAQRAAERVAIVAREWDACLLAGWTVTTYPARVTLDAVQARAVVIWAVLGVPVPGGARTAYLYTPTGEPPKRKQVIARRGWQRDRGDDVTDGEALAQADESQPADVVAAARATWAVELTVGHVVSLRVAGLRELYHRLRARGQVPLARHWEVEMVEPIEKPWDVEGWKDIAKALTMSEKMARKFAERAEHPMPVSVIAQTVVASRAELAAWVRAEFERNRRSLP